MIKIFKQIPKRLIITTILMAVILLMILVFIFGLMKEKSRIEGALELSQQNRDQLLRTERVTQSIVLVEARFREYCTTFEKPVFLEYQDQVKLLADGIEALHQSVAGNPTAASGEISEIMDAKSSEAETYMKLRLITDSLIFSTEDLREKTTELDRYIGNPVETIVDTVSITETIAVKKKGILGKIKSAIVGETVEQQVNTKLRVQTGSEADHANIRQVMIRALQANMGSLPGANFDELVRRTVQLKESELKLIEINNHLIAEIQALVAEIQSGIRAQEAEKNSFFLKTVQHSTGFLQKILIVLMILACILALSILWLALRNDKFQGHILALNDRITKDSIEKDKFYSIVNHDIMNPFNALLGYSQLLKDAIKEGDQAEMEECSTVVNQSAHRISNLLQNLLVWSRVQNGKIPFLPVVCSVNMVISEAVALADPMAKKKDITLGWATTGDIEAEIDPNMIGSVLQNLITNAIKFTETGGRVSIGASGDSDRLLVTVSDTGVGMSEEELQRLFQLDRAASTRGTGDESGTGLGLIIAKEFIEKHQGRIWAESVPGAGSTFRFTLPLTRG